MIHLMACVDKARNEMKRRKNEEQEPNHFPCVLHSKKPQANTFAWNIHRITVPWSLSSPSTFWSRDMMEKWLEFFDISCRFQKSEFPSFSHDVRPHTERDCNLDRKTEGGFSKLACVSCYVLIEEEGWVARTGRILCFATSHDPVQQTSGNSDKCVTWWGWVDGGWWRRNKHCRVTKQLPYNYIIISTNTSSPIPEPPPPFFPFPRPQSDVHVSQKEEVKASKQTMVKERVP